MQFAYVSTLLDMPHIALAMGVPAVPICHSVTQSCCFRPHAQGPAVGAKAQAQAQAQQAQAQGERTLGGGWPGTPGPGTYMQAGRVLDPRNRHFLFGSLPSFLLYT